ncbi:hypothetical protein EON83_02495 [bacterium]|nr:MAG: hypothetical protein EON83_02495 [bacterium]
MTIHDLFEPFEDELQLRPSPRIPVAPLIEWRAVFGDFFFRPKGANPQLLWCDLGYTVTDKRPLPQARQTTLTKRVSRVFAGRTFFRVVPFANGDDWALVRPKRALIKSPHQMTGACWQWNANFRAIAKTQLQWLSQDFSWFSCWLKEQQHKSEGLHQARDFALQSDEERSWTPIVAPLEIRAHWLELAQALQLLSAPPEEPSPIWWITTKPIKENLPCLFLDAKVHIRDKLTERQLQAALQLREELTTRFALPVDLMRWRGLEPNGEQQFYTFPHLTPDSASMHQKMEAALLWREFVAPSNRRHELEEAIRELID